MRNGAAPSLALSVLLVDDDEEDVLLTREALAEALGRCTVEWAPSIDAGLDSARRRPFDAYLVDYHLGAEDGIEFIRRAQQEGCDGPFVLLTGRAADETDLEALRAGASDYLSKAGLDPHVLGRSIRYAIERKRLERRLREMRTAEMLGVLAGGIAHEYNNRLMGVISRVDLAERRLPPGAEDVADHLRHAMAAARSAVELTQRVLAYSGAAAFHPAPVDLAELADRAIRLARDLVGQSFGVAVRLPERPPELVGDEGTLAQLLANVLVNAHEADPTARPTLEAAVEELSEESLATFQGRAGSAAGRFLSLVVTDRGPGMDEETLQRALDPFFSRKFLGRGLGLAAAGAIARRHGGALRLESRPGRGTTVTIAVPLAAGDPLADQTCVSTRSSGRGTLAGSSASTSRRA